MLGELSVCACLFGCLFVFISRMKKLFHVVFFFSSEQTQTAVQSVKLSNGEKKELSLSLSSSSPSSLFQQM